MKVSLILILLTSYGNSVDSNSSDSCDKIGSIECKDITEDETLQYIAEGVHSNIESKKTNGVEGYTKVVYYMPFSGILNCFENSTQWAEREETIFELAKLRHRELQQEVLAWEAYILDYESTTGKALEHSKWLLKPPKARANVLASSIIASYRLTYRYAQILQRLKEVMVINHLDKDLHDVLWKEKLPNSPDGYVDYSVRGDGMILSDWPNLIDLALAMHSLIHIQEVYNYDYNDLPKILSPETNKPPQLNAFHCARIGMHAMWKKHFAVGIEWIEHSVEMVNYERDSSIPLPLLETYLELAAKTHNKESRSKHDPGYKYTENLFTNIVRSFNPSYSNNERVSHQMLKFHREHKKPNYQDAKFIGVCSGEDYRTPQELSKLFCWYDTSSSPVRAIQPFKKELLSSEPEIVQVYDFIGNKLISRIVNDKTNCSGVSNAFDKSTLPQIMRSRTPTTCWPVHSKLESLWNKISSLTLTDLQTEEMSHTVGSVDYLSGRFYGVHRDTLQFTKDNLEAETKLAENGDRLFTMVIYLNDVAAGGWTPFPGGGTAAPPVKGSVVFWNNLYRNGSAREDTWHGACPVIYGHKQVAVVLLRSHSQFLTYPCSLNKYE